MNAFLIFVVIVICFINIFFVYLFVREGLRLKHLKNQGLESL